MKNILQRIIGFNTILPISHNLSQIQFIPSSDIVITIYFYPICYKVETFYYKYENPSDTFYTLKGGHQVNGLFCDGIYEVRTVEVFNRDIFSYAHFKCKKVSISCLGDTYFLFDVQPIIFFFLVYSFPLS